MDTIQSLNWQTITAVISALTALASAIVGPMIALRIARAQLRASTVSADHKEWIEAMRQDLAIFFANITQALAKHQFDKESDNEAVVSELQRAAVRVALRLDNSIEIQDLLDRALVELVQRAADVVKGRELEHPINDVYKHTYTLAKKVLRSELRRLEGPRL